MPAKVLIGTASWSDPGFVADWYPKRLPASERLRWYADHFNLVELNSSFYAVPQRKQVQRWCEQTPDGFVFDVKLHRCLSRHAATPQTLPPDLRAEAEVRNGRVRLTPALERKLAKRFLAEIGPFREASRLGALLLQLSPSFSPGRHRLDELSALQEIFCDVPLAVELRNRDWMTGEQAQKTLDFYRRHKLVYVAVDAPSEAHFMIMPNTSTVTSPELAYLRLHGRNTKGYVRGRTVAERFDYLYSATELEEIANRVVQMANEAPTMHVIYNNNASDYAPLNAEQFKILLGDKHPDISTGPKGRVGSKPAQLEFRK